MKANLFIVTSMAIFGIMANPAPSPMGVEVVRRDGLTMVREVVSLSDIDRLWWPLLIGSPRLTHWVNDAPTAFTLVVNA
jgi:hypothetical protein